jgi:hypothetical protein
MEFDYLPSDKVYQDDHSERQQQPPLAVLLEPFWGDGSGVALNADYTKVSDPTTLTTSARNTVPVPTAMPRRNSAPATQSEL